MPSKAELLEENLKLIKLSINGWVNTLKFLFNNVDMLGSDSVMGGLDSIITEMDNFSGD